MQIEFQYIKHNMITNQFHSIIYFTRPLEFIGTITLHCQIGMIEKEIIVHAFNEICYFAA
jgi:hypothetical protein